jgi:hypothetical protein
LAANSNKGANHLNIRAPIRDPQFSYMYEEFARPTMQAGHHQAQAQILAERPLRH